MVGLTACSHVENWWKIFLAVLNPVIATNGGANGVFIDCNNCKYRTCGEDQSQCCVFSEEADQEYNEGLKLVRYLDDDILQIFEFRLCFNWNKKTKK